MEQIDRTLTNNKTCYQNNFLKSADSNADISEFESSIDGIVYELYNLNEDEVKTIEKRC